MGCFNKTGFYSHLPIAGGDDVFVFVCAKQVSDDPRQDNQCPIGLTGLGFRPIAMPFFAKYDEYGGVYDVVDDANHQLFKNKFGMSLEDFNKITHDLSNTSIEDLENGIREMEEKPDNTNIYHHKTVDDYKKLLNIYENLFEKPEMFDLPVKDTNSEDNKKLLESFKRLFEYEMKIYRSISIVIIIDHKFIYDKMVEVGKATYFNDWWSKNQLSPEVAFDNTVDFMKRFKQKSDDDNEEFSHYPNPFIIPMEGLRHDELDKFYAIKACLYDTIQTDIADYALYGKIKTIKEIENLKSDAINYAYFMRVAHKTCTALAPSPYHNQDIDYKSLLPIYERMVDELKERIKDEEEN